MSDVSLYKECQKVKQEAEMIRDHSHYCNEDIIKALAATIAKLAQLCSLRFASTEELKELIKDGKVSDD